MFTAETALAFFVMLAISGVVFFIANRFKLPYTVLLTLTGVLLVPLSAAGPLHFIREFNLTPELLFFIFLPTLLFESAYNMHLRRIIENARPILLLAVISLLISAFSIAGLLFVALNLLGLGVPFSVTLIFGALISATDPVAVLALFKEFGAPRKLAIIFEGESIANDATALALFVVALGLATTGFTAHSLAAGAATFIVMLVGGLVLGLLLGALASVLIGYFREHEIVAVTLMLVLAHTTYLIAEILNESTAHAGIDFLKFSPIIATAAASVVMGTYGRYKLNPHAEEFVEKFWSQFAFMANSIVFMLVGLLFATVPLSPELLVPTLAAIGIVAFARALSVYGVIMPLNYFVSAANRIPLSWQHLLSWGSLRGALAVMLVLLVPAHFTVPGWTLAMSVQDFLLVLTTGCIFATLFIKAPTIPPLMRRMRVDTLTPLEEASEELANAMIEGATIKKLQAFSEKGYIPADIAESMIAEHTAEFQKSCTACRGESNALTERALSLYLLGYEKEVLKELFAFGEVNERTFREVYGKLTLQTEAVEAGNALNPSIRHDQKDIFDNISSWLNQRITPRSPEEVRAESILYYRAQEILARKVLKELDAFQNAYPGPIVEKSILDEVTRRYRTYRESAFQKREGLTDLSVHRDLARRSAFRVEEKILTRLKSRELLTPKLYIKLREDFERDVTAEAAIK